MKTELLIAFNNDVAIGDDGWAQIAPFGDFPGMALMDDGKGGTKKVRAIQRIDKEAVTQMVNEFQSSRRGVRKFLTGRKLFVGHPDVPGMKSRYPDAEPKGVFANLACRADGFYGEPILTDEGEQIIANKQYRALSGRWEADEVAEENGVKIYRPTKFISAGLTNQPNLPVQLLNESEDEAAKERKEHKVMKRTIAALTAAGITIANDANDETVSEEVKKLAEKAKAAATLETTNTTLANEKATLASEKTALEGKVTILTTEKATVTTERDTAKTAFANERQARIGRELEVGITSGRITAADKATWETRLKNETTFANELDALQKLTPSVKTKSVTLQRGERKVEISNAVERREMVTELVNERMAATKCSYDDAHAWLKKTHPTLFEAMEGPEIRKGGPKKN